VTWPTLRPLPHVASGGLRDALRPVGALWIRPGRIADVGGFASQRWCSGSIRPVRLHSMDQFGSLPPVALKPRVGTCADVHRHTADCVSRTAHSLVPLSRLTEKLASGRVRSNGGGVPLETRWGLEKWRRHKEVFNSSKTQLLRR